MPRFAACLAAVTALACQAGDPGADEQPEPTRPVYVTQEWSPPSAPAEASELVSRQPCANHDPLRQAFFGDLHTHTAFSLDALGRGAFQTPDDAYRFARGEALALGPLDDAGQPTRVAQLVRPLDFCGRLPTTRSGLARSPSAPTRPRPSTTNRPAAGCGREAPPRSAPPGSTTGSQAAYPACAARTRAGAAQACSPPGA